jgi:hypothetical protein
MPFINSFKPNYKFNYEYPLGFTNFYIPKHELTKHENGHHDDSKPNNLQGLNPKFLQSIGIPPESLAKNPESKSNSFSTVVSKINNSWQNTSNTIRTWRNFLGLK